MSHRVERAKSGRTRCTVCDQPIEKGDTRVAEEVTDASLQRRIHRFYHLTCAEPLLERMAEVSRSESPAPPVDLLTQLEDEPDDEELLAVLGDQLAEQGDPRGELIALQLATAHGQRDSPLAHRRTELMHQLAPPLGAHGKSTWGIGYLRRIDLGELHRSTDQDVFALWDHPSTRLVSELHLALRGDSGLRILANMRDVLPKSIRTLHVESGSPIEVGPLLATLPRLETVVLTEVTSFAELEHPRLARLAVMGQLLKNLGELDPARLPAVTDLTIRAVPYVDLDLDSRCAWFARSPWAERVTNLGMTGGRLTDFGADMLARALGGRRLVRLDLTGTEVTRAVRDRLSALCEILGEPERAYEPALAAEPWVEHSTQPAWGRGRVVRAFDGKVEIDFPGVGRKVFQANARFLRFGTD